MRKEGKATYIDVVKAASVGGRDLVFVGGANNDRGRLPAPLHAAGLSRND